MTWRGELWSVQEWRGAVRTAKEWQARKDMARIGKHWRGPVWLGEDLFGRRGTEWRDEDRNAMPRRGDQRFGRQGVSRLGQAGLVMERLGLRRGAIPATNPLNGEMK